MSQPTTPPPFGQSTAQAVEIFLGKDGQRFGPYTVEQFEALKATPEFATYTYIWDGRDAQPDWKAIERMPPPPPAPPKRQSPGAPPPDTRKAVVRAEPEPEPEPEARESRPRMQARPVLKGYDVPKLEALCHDSRSVITGKLTQVTDAGCEMVCAQNAVAPAFGTNSPVTINLLDPSSGRSMNVVARLGGVHRRGDHWRLRILWGGCPELVVQQLENTA